MHYKEFKGKLVVDARQGVIYFHDETGVSLLRVCQLDREKLAIATNNMDKPFIDLTVGYGMSVEEQA